MMYKKETGFAAIRRMEPDEALKAINEPVLSAEGEITLTLDGAVKGSAGVTRNDSLQEFLTRAGADADIKFIHVGAPLGVLLTKNDLDRSLADIWNVPGVSLGSLTIYVGSTGECSLAYIRKILDILKPESCGRCVLCRLGIDQVIRIMNDAVNGKGLAEDLTTLRNLASTMRKAAYCRFGKGVGALLESFCDGFSSEFEDHARRKKCAAMVCEKYLQYIILPNLCTGCGDCMDECEEDAIEGKPRYIHMIDEFECSRCGKCVKVCEEDAIVLAGASKPKLPVKLTRVGQWKG